MQHRTLSFPGQHGYHGPARGDSAADQHVRVLAPVERPRLWLSRTDAGSLASGELGRLPQRVELCGASIDLDAIARAVDGTSLMDDSIRAAVLEGANVAEICQRLVAEQARRVADSMSLRPPREQRHEGLVAVDLLPPAGATATMVEAARRLWRSVHRPNLMVKLPPTDQGLGAFYELMRTGINVLVTPLFDPARYDAVMLAYLDALSARAKQGLPLDGVVSLVGISLAPIDARVDPILAAMVDQGDSCCEDAASVRGRVALACAGSVYRRYQAVFGGSGFAQRKAAGARPQALPWLDTEVPGAGSGNIRYRDALEAPGTMFAIAADAAPAIAELGRQASEWGGEHQSELALQRLARLGIRLRAVAEELAELHSWELVQAHGRLLDAVQRKSASLSAA